MTEKRHDSDTRDRLTRIQIGYEQLVRRSMVTLGVLFIVLLALGVWSVLLSGKVSDEAVQARHLAKSNQALVRSISASRRQSLLTTCQQSNQRHDATIGQLQVIYKKDLRHLPKGTTKVQLRDSLQSTIGLINALAPTYVAGPTTWPLARREQAGCQARVNELTKG